MFCLCIKLYKWEVCTRERSGAKIRVRNLKTTNPRKISFRFEKHQSWVEKLPDFLCAGQVPAKLVEACLELVRKGHEGLQEGLKNHVKLILDNLPSLEITETDSLESVRKSLVNIFFYLPGLSSDKLRQIDTFIETHSDLSYSHYFKNVLELRTVFAK
jgi:hypothetical protein